MANQVPAHGHRTWSAGGLHWPVSLLQCVVAGTCLQGGLHWPVSLLQHVVAGTCLSAWRSVLARESFSTCGSWDMSAGGSPLASVFFSML